MISNGHVVGDGSWDLRIFVTNLQTERLIRVKGDTHMGGVMYKLTQDLEISMDWSDHGLWWPARNIWVNRVKFTLDQYGVQADALLYFTPMHKNLKVQLPDLRYIDMRVDVSVQTFSAVVAICKDLSIQHPEELSLCKPLEASHLKHNYKDMPKKKSHHDSSNGHHGGGGGQHTGHHPARNGSGGHPTPPPPPPDTNTFLSTVANNTHSSPEGSNGSLDKSPFLCAPMTPYRHTTATPPPHSTPTSGSPASYGNTWKRNGYGTDLNGSYGSNINTSLSLEQLNGSHDSVLADSPLPTPEARKTLVRPKTLVEKARMNVAWLDSSLSIMEQGVKEYDILCLRFKFYVFYDLNPKTDAVRINQIYEQAKWQLLNEEIDCTEEEMLMFAALQLQVNTQANHPQKNYDNGNISPSNEDDIDAALTDLQTTLEGSSIGSYPSDITKVPELYDQLRFLKPKRFTLKAFKKYWFSYRDLHLYLFKTREEMYHHTNHVQSVSLKGCEVTPDINLSQNKYGIKLDVPSAEGMTEMYIRCDNEKQYAVWMAACRLASKGRSLADSSYENEIKSIMELLTMQKPGEGPTMSPDKIDIQPELYLSPRYARKLKGKVEQRILESHANVKNLPLVDAKMKYIKAWQSLPDYGISLFVVKFTNTKKDELLGVAHNRIMKMDINSGDNLKTWRYNTLKAWNVNWEVKLMMTQFEEENLMFNCLSADCKVIHEFIGGYIFLSMRSKEANQSLNQELFHKLTGGWT